MVRISAYINKTVRRPNARKALDRIEPELKALISRAPTNLWPADYQRTLEETATEKVMEALAAVQALYDLPPARRAG